LIIAFRREDIESDGFAKVADGAPCRLAVGNLREMIA
jgi:hypothetical protein